MSVKTKLNKALLKTASYVRERRIRMPSLPFLLSPGRKKARTAEQRALVQQIRRDGIVKIPDLVKPEWLADMQAGMERMVEVADARQAEVAALADDPDRYEAAKVATRRASYTTEHGSCYYDDDYEFYACHDPFYFSTGLARFAVSDELMPIINSYYRKQGLLARGILHRLQPKLRPRGLYGFVWHHDGWGRKVNAMILLTEIGDGDQHMAYKKGTHRAYRGFRRFDPATFSDEEVARDFAGHETFRCTGNPGDVFVFDSNGLHSAVATEGRVRDTCVFMFYGDGTFNFRQTIPDELLAGARPSDLHPLREILRRNAIRDRRHDNSLFPLRGRSWPKSLGQVGEWLF